jgi:hypothetical protein
VPEVLGDEHQRDNAGKAERRIEDPQFLDGGS